MVIKLESSVAVDFVLCSVRYEMHYIQGRIYREANEASEPAIGTGSFQGPGWGGG